MHTHTHWLIHELDGGGWVQRQSKMGWKRGRGGWDQKFRRLCLWILFPKGIFRKVFLAAYKTRLFGWPLYVSCSSSISVYMGRVVCPYTQRTTHTQIHVKQPPNWLRNRKQQKNVLPKIRPRRKWKLQQHCRRCRLTKPKVRVKYAKKTK